MQIKHGSMALALAIHAGLLGLLFLPVNATSIKAVQRPLVVFDIPGPVGPAAPPKPPQPIKIELAPPTPIRVPPAIVLLPSPSPIVAASVDANVTPAAGGQCDLTEPVQAALRASPAVQTALFALPRQERSVANAIMIWDTNWVPFAEASDGVAQAAVRDAITAVITSASDECRLQPQSGPRLLILPVESGTIILALGSGIWRWQALLDTARPEGRVAGASAGDQHTDLENIPPLASVRAGAAVISSVK